jgi:ubiquinone/menaquinone biosynthesis C-methylase UbiE
MNDQANLLTMTPIAAYEQFMVPGIMIPGTQALLAYAKPKLGERVLDVACGTGIVARTIAPLVGNSGAVTAIDLNPGMVAYARSLPAPSGAVIDWREGDVQALPLPDQSFDLVVSNQGFQFFPDKVTALREIYRVLVLGGRVAVNVQQSLEHNPIYQKFNAVLTTHLNVPALAAPFAFGEVESLRAVLTEAGFKDVQVISITHEIRFPSVDIFLQASIIGSAAVLPVLAKLDADAKQRLLDQIRVEMTPTLAPYVKDGMLVMPLAANIGMGVV